MYSHYCRKDSKKFHLEGYFGSKMQIFRLYKRHCEENNQQALSIFIFWEIFENMNLSLFSSKKNQCNICLSYTAGNIKDEEYKKHFEVKDKAQLEKSEYK